MIVDGNVLLLIIAIIAHLGLGLLVILNRPSVLFNRLIFSLSFNTACWGFAVLMITILNEYNALVLWVRISHAVGIMIFWHVYALSVTFPSGNPLKTAGNRFVFLLTLFTAAMAFSPLFIEGINLPVVNKEPLFGPFYLFYFAVYGGLVLYSLGILYKKLTAARGLMRVQLRYLFGGILVSIILSSLANVVLPIFSLSNIGGLDIRPLGPFFSLAMVASISYAIIKFQFMDLSFAVKRNMSTVLTVIVYIIMLIALYRFLVNLQTGISGLVVEVIIAFVVIAIILLMPILDNFFRTVLDKYFFIKPYDYRSTLVKEVEALSRLLDYDQLINSFVKVIVLQMGLEHGFYYCKLSGELLTSYSAAKNDQQDQNQQKREPDPNGFLIPYLEEHKDILLQSSLKRGRAELKKEYIERELYTLRSDVVVPMLTGSELEGLLFLGPKQSGEPFFKEDIQLLSILSSQITVILKNARLYEDLLNTKQYLEKIVSSMGNGLIAISDKGIITVYNDEAEIITGVKADDALGCRAVEKLDSKLYKLYEKAVATGDGLYEDEVIMLSGRRKSYLTCDISIIEFKEKGSYEVLMVISNITRIKELEQERSQSKRLATLGEMVAGIAHEIKNPLVSIKTFAELLPEKYQDPHFRNEYAKVVSQEIMRINNLITEMLNYVKQSELFLQPLRIDHLLNDLILLLTPQLEANNIKVKKNYDHQMLLINADSSLLMQALLNICVNAIQAMPNGGELKIGFKPFKRYTKIKGEYITGLMIIIEDSGTGIDQGISDNIFDPFVTSKADGIGLGLSVSHKIINAHRGRIDYETEPGVGTRFIVYLPERI